MKKCTRCKKRKGLSQFYKRVTSSDGYGSRCKTCHKKFTDRWFTRNKTKRLFQIKVRNERLREQAANLKTERGCLCCPEKDSVCLDWHHLDPKVKEGHVTDMITHNSWKAVLQELEKCVVVCRNCHAKIHAGKIKLQGIGKPG